MIYRLSVLILIVVFTSAGLSARNCQAAAPDQKPLTIGFLYVGPLSDWGWNYAQDLGRLAVEAALKNKVRTTVAENVPESAEAERVMERMIAQGCKLIFASSYGYLEPVERVAARHPDVKFMQLSRFVNKPNIGTYFYLGYQAMYAAGVVAGRLTKNNKLGFVAANPVPPLLQSINAYFLGVRSVNAKAKLKVVWTNKWVDPATETEAAKSLIDAGIDVMAFDQSAPLTVVKTCQANKIPVIGCYTDDLKFAPQYWLTGCQLDWGPFYTKVAQSVIDNQWQAGMNICDMSTNGVRLCRFGPLVPKPVAAEALKVADRIKSGQLTVFAGPVIDANGKERLAAGKKPEIKWLAAMDFFVSGIEGNLPRK